jgi:hypothetical protein
MSGHDRGIHDTQSFHAPNAELRIDNRELIACVPHLAGAERMVHRGCGLEIVVGQGGGVRRNLTDKRSKLLPAAKLNDESQPWARDLSLSIRST